MEKSLRLIEFSNEELTLQPFDAQAIEGYEWPVNNEVTGEQFPNCCSFHSQVFKESEDWFNKEQEKLITNRWFQRANYNGLALKVVRQLSQTEYLISEKIMNADWYKAITHYIQYNVSSFGIPSVGEHLYLNALRYFLLNTPNGNWSNEQKKSLVNFIEDYHKPKNEDKTDLNLLIDTYQKWLKAFPFELKSYFGDFKEYFNNLLPLFIGEPERNIYFDCATVIPHTQSSLIKQLTEITKLLISKIDTETLLEQGVISDFNKHTLKLRLEKLRVETSEITQTFNKGEKQYIKALKQWLRVQIEFFKDLPPLLQSTQLQPEPKAKPKTIPPKPVFKAEAVETVFEILKDYFDSEQQPQLLEILKSGNNATEKLIFNSEGNKLTDTFLKLYEGKFIAGYQKKDLINWIFINFQYVQNTTSKNYTFKSIEKVISGTQSPCKNPLIKVSKEGQIEIIR